MHLKDFTKYLPTYSSTYRYWYMLVYVKTYLLKSIWSIEDTLHKCDSNWNYTLMGIQNNVKWPLSESTI